MDCINPVRYWVARSVAAGLLLCSSSIPILLLSSVTQPMQPAPPNRKRKHCEPANCCQLLPCAIRVAVYPTLGHLDLS